MTDMWHALVWAALRDLAARGRSLARHILEQRLRQEPHPRETNPASGAAVRMISLFTSVPVALLERERSS